MGNKVQAVIATEMLARPRRNSSSSSSYSTSRFTPFLPDEKYYLRQAIVRILETRSPKNSLEFHVQTKDGLEVFAWPAHKFTPSYIFRRYIFRRTRIYSKRAKKFVYIDDLFSLVESADDLEPLIEALGLVEMSEKVAAFIAAARLSKDLSTPEAWPSYQDSTEKDWDSVERILTIILRKRPFAARFQCVLRGPNGNYTVSWPFNPHGDPKYLKDILRCREADHGWIRTRGDWSLKDYITIEELEPLLTALGLVENE